MIKKLIFAICFILVTTATHAQGFALGAILSELAKEAVKSVGSEAGKSAIDYFKDLFNGQRGIAKNKNNPKLTNGTLDNNVREWKLSPSGSLSREEINEIAKTLKSLEPDKEQSITFEIDNHQQIVQTSQQGLINIKDVQSSTVNIYMNQGQTSGNSAATPQVATREIAATTEEWEDNIGQLDLQKIGRGATLTVKSVIDVPANVDQVVFRAGEILPPGYDFYQTTSPICYLSINESDTLRYLRVGTVFTVNKVREYPNENIQSKASPPIVMPTNFTAVSLDLSSNSVRKMVCGAKDWDPKVQQARDALGSFIQIKSASPKPLE
jgi:hypothetical protein